MNYLYIEKKGTDKVYIDSIYTINNGNVEPYIAKIPYINDNQANKLIDEANYSYYWYALLDGRIYIEQNNNDETVNIVADIKNNAFDTIYVNVPRKEIKINDIQVDSETALKKIEEINHLKGNYFEDKNRYTELIVDKAVDKTVDTNIKNGWHGDYYYQNEVPVKNTWVDYGSDKYYCGSTGAIVKKQWIDNTYYVDNTGKMLKNTTTPDGYKVGADGKYIKETKVSETKTPETKPQETKPQETKAKTNTTTNSSNKLTPLSEEELNDLDDTAIFHLTVNNQYMDFIKIGTEKDGFLGLFGNTKYYVKFGYKLKLPEEELVTDYGNKYNNIDGNVIDCLGNKIKKYSYWIPSYTIYTNTKKEADNIKEYIESGNDYTAYFFDAMIESTGKYKADPKSAIFKVPFISDMVKYARPSKTPNIKLEQDDDGVELIDGYGMSVKIGKDISEVRIEFNKNISEDLKEKIMNYDWGHQAVGTNIIDNYGHKIVKFYYSSFGTYAIYAENYQKAEEIASELNNKDCNYTLYFYDNVKESTGKHRKA